MLGYSTNTAGTPASSSARCRRRADAIGRDLGELRRNGLAGSPQEVVDKIGQYGEVGATRIYLQVLDLSDLDSPATVDLRSGSAANDGDDDRVALVETVIGTQFDDTLAGDGRPNHLQGGAGNDLLQGRGGNDTLDGGSGTDRCAGGAGTDTALACETVNGVP